MSQLEDPKLEKSGTKAAPPAGGGWGGPQPVLTLPGGRAVNPWLVLLSIVFGFFMSLLDATITNIALSNIQNNLSTDLTTVSWVINSYSLTFAALLVTMGRFADQFGRKRVFMIGMVIFSFGSLLCAIAPSIELLIAFRVVQAVGAAALNSVSLAIILAVFPKEKRGAAIGIWGALAGLAAAVGPVLGGFLLEVGKGNLEWRWIFYVNIPFCIIGLLMIARNVPEMKDPNATTRIDFAGLITSATGMFCLAFALIQGNEWGWTSLGTLGLLAGAVIGLVAFYFVETRQAQPILDFSLFKIRSFTAANIVMIMFSISIQGAFLMLVLYFINAQNQSPLEAAYSIIPLALSSFVISALSSRIGNRVSPRNLAIAGMAILGVGMLSLWTLGTDASFLDTFWREVLIGIGMALCFVSLPNISLSEVPRNKLGVGSGAFNTFRQFGFVVGVAIWISLFSGQIQNNIVDAKARAISDVNAAQGIPAPAKEGIIAGLQKASSSSGRQGNNNNAAQLGQYGNTPLGQQISHEFKKASVDAFTVVWFGAAMIALFGVIPAFFTSAPAQKAPGEASSEASAAAAAV